MTSLVMLSPVVSAGDEIWFVSSLEVVYAVDTLFMSLQSEVRGGGA